jgi:hypothetical protein
MNDLHVAFAITVTYEVFLFRSFVNVSRNGTGRLCVDVASFKSRARVSDVFVLGFVMRFVLRTSVKLPTTFLSIFSGTNKDLNIED